MSEDWSPDHLKELIETRLTAMEKAVDKADSSLKTAEFLRRTEADGEFKRLRELIDAQTGEIAGLRESRSAVQGETAAQAASRVNARWLAGVGLTIVLAVIGFLLKR